MRPPGTLLSQSLEMGYISVIWVALLGSPQSQGKVSLWLHIEGHLYMP